MFKTILASLSNVQRQLNVEPIASLWRNRSWCLAYQIIENNNQGNKERVFKIVKPDEVYLDDDHQTAIDLKPLCALDEPDLIKLYEIFGSKMVIRICSKNFYNWTIKKMTSTYWSSIRYVIC